MTMTSSTRPDNVRHLPRATTRRPQPPTGLARQFVHVAGRRVEVCTLGDPTHEPVVFLHGFGACPDIYRSALGALAARGRYVIAPALPSFGRSAALPLAHQGVGGVARHMTALLGEISDLVTGPLDLVGHSFGGGIALRMGATRPDLVRSLTLVSPVGGADQGAMSVRQIVSGLIVGDGGKGWIRNGAQHLVPAVARHAPGVLVAGLSAWFSAQTDDVDAVARHEIATRFLFADLDHLVRPGSIPTRVSRTVTVEFLHGRHSWLIGEPERFAAVVTGERGQTGPTSIGPAPAA